MTARRWTVGVDFGGTNIKVGVVTDAGRVICKTVLVTAQHATPQAFAEGLRQAIQRLATQGGFRRKHLRGVGVGVPGLMDGDRGLIYELVNVPGGWRNVRLQHLLEQRLRCPCAVDNDVNVVALGEWRLGAGRGTRHSVYITLGTGIGGGLVVDGHLVRGAVGSAGEIGHTKISLDGPLCGCGRHGCLEAFVGTASLVRHAGVAMRGGSGLLRRLARQHHGTLTPALISQAAQHGDRAARKIWQDMGRHLGIGLANLVNVLSPERIVIGGGVARAWPWFAPAMKATLRQLAFRAPARACRVVRAKLGDRAGIVGGAILVWEQQTRR